MMIKMVLAGLLQESKDLPRGNLRIKDKSCDPEMSLFGVPLLITPGGVI